MVGLGLPTGAAGDSFRRDKAACWLIAAAALGVIYRLTGRHQPWAFPSQMMKVVP